MDRVSKRRLLGGLALLAVCGAGIYCLLWWQKHLRMEDGKAVYSAINLIGYSTQKLRDSDADKSGMKGYWTGDVAGLHALGLIPQEIAEADAAPLQPLAEKPKPYHGYLFVAMEVGQEKWDPDRTPIKLDPAAGKTRHPTVYGFCAYPAEGGRSEKTHKPVYLVGPRGVYAKSYGPAKAVLVWPGDREFQDYWAICD